MCLCARCAHQGSNTGADQLNLATPQEELEFAKILCCSTAHMTYNDSCILSDCPHLNVVEYEYGFYIELDYTLGQENVLFDLWLYGLSQALIRVLVDAYKELDCRFIRFAADDPQYDRYTLHDW